MSKSRTVDDPAPVPPTPPDLEQCCASGCNPCVFDLYGAAHERYLTALAAWHEGQAAQKSGR